MSPRPRNDRSRVGRFLIIVVVILLVWSLVAWIAAQALIVSAPLDRADAIVVFSGSSVYLERVRHAAKLYHDGCASRIVLTNDNVKSSWSEERQTNPLFVERARDELLSAG